MATEDADSDRGLREAKVIEPVWYVTRMHFRINLARAPVPGRLGRLRRWLALRLWPELAEPQVVEGVMEYCPARRVD